MIRQIYVPGILRSERLRSDLAVLRSLTVTATDPDSTMRRGRKETVKQRHMKWSTDADADTDSAVRAFSSHIQSAVQRRPHVLLAYAWVLYMALSTTDAGGTDSSQAVPSSGATLLTMSKSDIMILQLQNAPSLSGSSITTTMMTIKTAGSTSGTPSPDAGYLQQPSSRKQSAPRSSRRPSRSSTAAGRSCWRSMSQSRVAGIACLRHHRPEVLVVVSVVVVVI